MMKVDHSHERIVACGKEHCEGTWTAFPMPLSLRCADIFTKYVVFISNLASFYYTSEIFRAFDGLSRLET